MTAPLEDTRARKIILELLLLRGYPMTIADFAKEEAFTRETSTPRQIADALATLERLGFVSAEKARAAGFLAPDLAYDLTAAGEAQINAGLGLRRHPAVWGKGAL
jgi:DNA-binding PadR family transcriptional regulator